MSRHATEPFRKSLSVAVSAARTNLGAAPNRVPSRVSPFNLTVCAHLADSSDLFCSSENAYSLFVRLRIAQNPFPETPQCCLLNVSEYVRSEICRQVWPVVDCEGDGFA